jgi:hypothetical protein
MTHNPNNTECHLNKNNPQCHGIGGGGAHCNGCTCPTEDKYTNFIKNGLQAGFTDDQINFLWDWFGDTYPIIKES